MYHTEPVPGVPPTTAFADVEREPPTPVPRGMPPVGNGKQLLGMLVASRGGGKTTFLLDTIARYMKAGSFAMAYVVSPTSHLDPKVLHALKWWIDKGQVVVSDQFDFDEVRDQFDAIRAEWDLIKEYRPIWARFKRSSDEDLDGSFSPEELRLLEHFQYKPPPKTSEWPPSFLLVFDDCLGDSSVFHRALSSAFYKDLIAHRHHRVSILFSIQTWTNSLPPGLRANCNLYVLWAQKNRAIRKGVAEAVSSWLEPDSLISMWEAVTARAYTPLILSFDTPDAMYRAGWNRKILLPAENATQQGDTRSVDRPVDERGT